MCNNRINQPCGNRHLADISRAITPQMTQQTEPGVIRMAAIVEIKIRGKIRRLEIAITLAGVVLWIWQPLWTRLLRLVDTTVVIIGYVRSSRPWEEAATAITITDSRICIRPILYENQSHGGYSFSVSIFMSSKSVLLVGSLKCGGTLLCSVLGLCVDNDSFRENDLFVTKASVIL